MNHAQGANPRKAFDKLLSDLGVNEKLTKGPRKQKVFNKVKDNIPKVAHYNYQADLLFLPTSERAKLKFKYLLVMVDIANDAFDIEPITNKLSSTVLEATKRIFKRGILKPPKASIRTDSGTEFKGDFKKYLHDHNILLKTSLPDRHKQTGNVERLNREISRIIMSYLDKLDQENGEVNTQWLKVIPIIRKRLNSIRKKKLPKGDEWKTMDYPIFEPTEEIIKKTKEGKTKVVNKLINPTYKKGDRVHRALDRPQNAQGDKLSGSTFRMGDRRWSSDKKKIVQVLMYPGTAVHYRYMLEGIKEASFSKHELKK
jgi:hypothetical protein